jgi:hypothetical protein
MTFNQLKRTNATQLSNAFNAYVNAHATRTDDGNEMLTFDNAHDAHTFATIANGLKCDVTTNGRTITIHQ